jgi:uncharacterized caspase-like protein
MSFIRIVFASVLAIGLSTLSAFANSSQPGKRVALVVGNSAYQHAVALPNPVRDARLMSTTLKAAGFEVIEGFDTEKAALEALIDQFTEAAYGADLGLIYYAGHGLQVDGKNFIIPVDAELTSPAHLKSRAIDVGNMISTLPPDPAVGIVILDACRDNPLARTLAASMPASRSQGLGQGLAAVQATDASNGAGGILIAYATDPGAVALDGKGENSPYTAALVRHITTPGLEIQSALTRVRGEVTDATGGKQRPWHNASLGREVFIGGQPSAVPPVSGESSPVAGSTPPNADQIRWEEEQRFWDEAARRDTSPYYRAYLDRFPNGRFASIAKLNIETAASRPEVVANLDPAAAPQIDPSSQTRMAISTPLNIREEIGTAITDAELGLGKNERIDLQLRLTAAGLDVGPIDGDIGSKSRSAIASWQSRHQIAQTTFLTRNQYQLLLTETEPLIGSVRAEYQAAKFSQEQRKRELREANRTQPTRKSVERREQGNNIGKSLGAFGAGVAAGAIGCKLLKC